MSESGHIGRKKSASHVGLRRKVAAHVRRGRQVPALWGDVSTSLNKEDGGTKGLSADLRWQLRTALGGVVAPGWMVN